MVSRRCPHNKHDLRLEALMKAICDGAAFGVFICVIIVTMLAFAPQP